MRYAIVLLLAVAGCTAFGTQQDRTLKTVDKGGDAAKIMAEMNRRENAIRAAKYQIGNIAKGATVYIYDSPEVPMPMEETHASINSDAKTKWDASSDETFKLRSGWYWVLIGVGMLMIVGAIIAFVKLTKTGAAADGAVGIAGKTLAPMLESFGRACSKMTPGTEAHALAEDAFGKVKAAIKMVEEKYGRRV